MSDASTSGKLPQRAHIRSSIILESVVLRNSDIVALFIDKSVTDFD